MREAMGYAAKAVSDEQNKELKPAEIYQVFEEKCVGITEPYHITEVHFKQVNGITTEVTTTYKGEKMCIRDRFEGNGCDKRGSADP